VATVASVDINVADGQALLSTGIRDQRLVVEGWIASHADAGTPGPHVHLRTSDRKDAVLKTSQVPALIDGLTQVAAYIDRAWAEEPNYPFGPDYNDPAVIRQQRIRDLEFLDALHARLPAVVALLLGAEDHAAVSPAIGELLGYGEGETDVRLRGINMFAFTRVTAAARAQQLAELRQQD
jgi:hypothetical protein